MLIKILLNDAFLKGTAEINEFRFAFPFDVFQLATHTPRWTLLSFYWRPPTKGVDTGPSCKELGVLKIQLFHI